MIGLETTPYSVLPLPGSPFVSQPPTPLPETGGFVWPSVPPSPSQPAPVPHAQVAVPATNQLALSPRSSISGGSVYSTPVPETDGHPARASTQESLEAPSLDHLPSSHSSHPSEPPAPPTSAPYFLRESTSRTSDKKPIAMSAVEKPATLSVSVERKAPATQKPQPGATALSKLRSRARSWSRLPKDYSQKSSAPTLSKGQASSASALSPEPVRTSPSSSSKLSPKPSAWKWGGSKPKDIGSGPPMTKSAPQPKDGKSHTRGRANSLGATAWKALKLPSKEPTVQPAMPPSK